MKTKFIYSILMLSAMMLASCEDWLDVQPRTKVKSTDLLKTEAGFNDALIGCYTLMKQEALYSREMTFGFVDNVTSAYFSYYNNPTYNEVAQLKFTESTAVRSTVNAIWTKMYNMIANVNNILDNIDDAKGVFTGDNYNLVKGEALGLRAYAHFDLLRLFASAQDFDKQAIPYVKSLQIEVPTVYTGNEVIRLVNEDLTAALSCLENDPIRKGSVEERRQRINYYAIKALQARVAMWAGDKQAAMAAAKDVIDVADELFPWVASSNIASLDDKSRDYAFASEQLFALNVNDLKTLVNTWFFASDSKFQLFQQSYYAQRYFEITGVGATDYRVMYCMKAQVGGNGGYAYYKFYQPEGYKSTYAKRLPMLRRSEMYYIMAECLMGTDDTQALEYLNTVRRHRGILTDVTDPAKLRDEINKEYYKEFVGEGQLFFLSKRLGLAKCYNGSMKMSEAKGYILPKPDNEIEFGNYYTVEE